MATTDLINGSEPIVAAIKARIDTTLNGFITSVNALVTDGTTISNPITFDYVPTETDLVSFPAVGIQEGTFHLEDDTGWGATGVQQFGLVIFEQRYSQEELARSLRRLRAAVTACILAGRSIGPGWAVVLKRVDPGPTLSRDETPRQYMSLTVVTVEIRFNQDT